MSKRSSGQSDTCHICHLKNPPQRDNKVQPKRTAKSTSLKEHTHINWICCDACRLWCHSDCCGLTQKDHRKLTSGKQFFKCICCCISDSCWIKEAKYYSVAGDPELPSSVSSASAIDVTVTSQPNKHEVQLSDALPCNSGIGVNNHVNTEEVGVDTTNINSQPTEQVRDTSLSTEDIDLEVQQERQNIIIVDCISNPTQFTRSDNILREVQSFAPLIQVKYAYSLAKGGVAIHLNNTEDKLTLLNSFTAEAFGGAKISDLAERNYTLSLRNVPTYVDLETVRLALKEKSIEAKKLLRQQHKLTGRPQPVIKVVSTDTDANKLANHTFITVGRHTCDVVRNNARVLRCYNCQQFGHIARTCTNPRRCINCSDLCCSNGYCRKAAKCVNCEGPHRASERSCPIYQQRHAILAGQHPQPQYIKKSVGTDRVNSPNRGHAAAGNMGGEGKCQHERLSTTSD